MAQREIKFRVWNKVSNKYMSNDTSIMIGLTGSVETLNYAEIDEDITDDVILEQYTGQKDNHWVETYEGDRVVIFKDGDEIANGYVVFKDYKFYIETNDRGFEYDYFDAVIEDGSYSFEVIGNIHEK